MNNYPSSSNPVEQWLAALSQQGRSQHTVAAYRRALYHFVTWSHALYGEDFNPSTIIGRDVRDWKGYQQTVEKVAPATINQRLVALSRFFSWAFKQGIVRENPTQDVGNLHLPPRQPQGLTQRDLRRLLRTVHSSGSARDIAVIEVLVGTGLRVGELLALQIGDVTLRERSGMVTVRQGKGGKYRQVPLTADVRSALAAYLEKHSEKDNPAAPLWLGTRGGLNHRSSMVRLLNKYTYLAQIEPIKIHALRHTFATRYLQANPDDLRGLAALLGHANLDTVMIYTEPRVEDLAERMERVEYN